MIWIFLLIYLASFIIHIWMLWAENRRRLFKVGDLIDSIEFYMWFPILNTMFLILVGICIVIGYIIIKLKLNVLWDKFRNIKLK